MDKVDSKEFYYKEKIKGLEYALIEKKKEIKELKRQILIYFFSIFIITSLQILFFFAQ